MPSLRQKVTTYFRQLSFIAEPRDGGNHRGRKGKNEDDENFITKYLEGRIERIFVPGPEIKSASLPNEMPDLKIGSYMDNGNVIVAACTGPDEGLTGIKRSKLHLSASFADDIDFIDTITDNDCIDVRCSATSTSTSSTANRNINNNNNNNTINNNNNNNNNKFGRFSDQNANKTNVNGLRSRKNSKSNIANLNQSIAKDATTTIVVSMVNKTNTNKDDDYQNNKNIINTSINSTTKNDNVNNINKQTKDINATTSIQPTSNTSVTTTTTTTTTNQKDIINKLLENTTERLLHEAVSNQSRIRSGISNFEDNNIIAGVSNWKMPSECAYGISVSLYETNQLTKEHTGNPIADCYGMLVRGDAALLALADGVNWGDGARLAARSAVHGCLDYLDRAIFSLTSEVTSTQEVFVSLLRGIWEGHGCILEVGGALSTLTVAVVLPLKNITTINSENQQQYVVCACNVGDSLGYVYSKKHGVREFTQASHDITSMRDMRDALGALGPADGNKPELSNLTFSMTLIERGDIVFLTSDGISDNFDPVVGKFAEAWTPDVKMMPSKTTPSHGGVLAPKRQNKSASAIYARLHSQQDAHPVPTPRTKKHPVVLQPVVAHSRPKYMRSHTVIEPRRPSTAGLVRAPLSPTADMINAAVKIPKTITGLPLVTGPQRHALMLYRLEDLLSYGINGTFSPCVSARRLCHLLIDFVRMITSARRKTLEQRELFYKVTTTVDGNRREVELNRMQHRVARKRVIDSSTFAALPGKLDHATVVAYTVGASAIADLEQKVSLQSKEFKETNF